MLFVWLLEFLQGFYPSIWLEVKREQTPKFNYFHNSESQRQRFVCRIDHKYSKIDHSFTNYSWIPKRK